MAHGLQVVATLIESWRKLSLTGWTWGITGKYQVAPIPVQIAFVPGPGRIEVIGLVEKDLERKLIMLIEGFGVQHLSSFRAEALRVRYDSNRHRFVDSHGCVLDLHVHLSGFDVTKRCMSFCLPVWMALCKAVPIAARSTRAAIGTELMWETFDSRPNVTSVCIFRPPGITPGLLDYADRTRTYGLGFSGNTANRNARPAPVQLVEAVQSACALFPDWALAELTPFSFTFNKSPANPDAAHRTHPDPPAYHAVMGLGIYGAADMELHTPKTTASLPIRSALIPTLST